MTLLDYIGGFQKELIEIRQHIHNHPELGLEEFHTADLVAKKLASWGIEVHQGVGGTGVVGILRSGNSHKTIGLRADMDALPISESTELPYSSKVHGVMHACGHDGHTTMLLGAAKYLAETRDFDGTVNFIFQPGEEGVGGALAMLADGLFSRFPCEAIYALHNRPGLEIGHYAICPGPAMAGGAFFDIIVNGRGAHGARPEVSIDPILAACHIGAALQSVVARNVPAYETAVLSITKIVGGDAYNVIPQFATISGTARAFKSDMMDLIESSVRRVAEGVAAGFGATVSLDFRTIFAPLNNDPDHSRILADTASSLAGEEKVDRASRPVMGSEDFSFMMQQVPGAYMQIGNGPSAQLHNHAYDFSDAAIPFGAALLAGVVERQMPKGAF